MSLRHRAHSAGAIVLAAACGWFLTGTAATQTRDTPARLAPPAQGTGTISGTLLSDETTPRPIRRATLRLTGSNTRGSRIAVTDDSGRFAFTRLPAGSFSLSATKVGYVTVYYGGKRPGRGPGVAIALTEGQQLPLAIRMPRGAVITGTIVDTYGLPAPRIQVQVVSYQTRNGELVPARDMASGPVMTDDRGTYRIFGLPPGTYSVSASPSLSMSGGELRPVTAEELQWALQQLPSATSRSSITPGQSAPMPPAGKPIGYAPVYFPGTTDAAGATKITVGAGEERAGVNFGLQFVPTAKIEGILVDITGQPVPTATLSFVPKSVANNPDMGELGLMVMARPSVANGKFTVSGVAPGAYTLLARSGSASGPRAGGAGPAGPTLWGDVDVVVNGQDQSDLMLTLRPGMTVTGSIVFESAVQTPPPDMTRVRVQMQSAQAFAGVPAATVRPDGTFTFASVAPGKYLVRPVAPALPGADHTWTLKSVIATGHDIADVPLDVKPGEPVSGVVVTFTDQPGEISGTLVDAAGRPTPEFSIVIFTADRALWTPSSRRVRATRPASDGTFKIAGLPSGLYHLAAVTDYEPNEIYDPAFLELLQAASYRITLGDGEKKRQDLKVAGGRP